MLHFSLFLMNGLNKTESPIFSDYHLVFISKESLLPNIVFEQGHNIPYQIVYAPSQDADQPAHPRSLIRVFP